MLAVVILFFAGNRSHAIPLFVSAYFETVCSLMHDISTNSAPQNIRDIFTCSSDILKLVNNSRSLNKENHDLDGSWISDLN